MKSNLAQEQQSYQAEVVQFPKNERQAMSDKDEGYTRLPNLLIDSEIMADLSDKAFKCLMFIVRQTMGFGRASHTIAITQFQKYCGLKKRDTAMSAIRELEECFLIKVERKTGCLNEYFLTLNQYRKKGLVPSQGSTSKQDGTSTVKGDGTSTAKRDTIKETFKENIKEIHTQENTCEKIDFDEQWKPKISFLKTLLCQTKFGHQTNEILGMVDFEFHLGNFNAHWEDKITLTENQKTRKFAAWLVQEFEKAQNKKSFSEKQTSSRDVNQKWGEVQEYAPATGEVNLEGLM